MTVTGPNECPYCLQVEEPDPTTIGDLIHRDEHWLVRHGPTDAARPGTAKIIACRHYTDFAEMTVGEAASFGQLIRRLDAALRGATDAERVHLVSTRDRVPHFHAWLYPRPANSQLRGTDFLAAPQQSSPTEAQDAARAIRHALLDISDSVTDI